MIWNQTKKISVCNRPRLLQFKILRRLQISPYKKLQNENPTFNFYVYNVKSLSQNMGKIFGEIVQMDPISLLHGHPSQDSIIGVNSIRLYNIFTYAARQHIFMSWIKEKLP